MTAALANAVQQAVADGGALSACAIDRETRAVLATAGSDGPLAPAMLDLLLGSTSPSGPLTRACGGPPVNAVRQVLLTGRERALFVQVVGRAVFVVATPVSMSVALGWTLVRTLTSATATGAA